MPRFPLTFIIPLLAFVLLLVLAPSILLIIFAGILVGVFLRLGGNAVSHRTGLGESWGLALFLIVLAVLILAFFALAAVGLVGQFSQLVDQLPQAHEQVRDMLSEHEWLISRLEGIDGIAPSGPGAATTVLASFGAMGNFVLILFIGIYIAISPAIYRRGAEALFTPPQQRKFHAMLHSAWEALSGWLFAQLIAMTVIGVLTRLGLWALGVPLATILAVLAGLLTFIPNIGPVLAAIPAMAMGLSGGGMTVLWVVALYLAVQTLESYLITPQLQQEAVSLPPALTIAFQLLLGFLFGLLGLALATPLLAMIVTLVRDHYVADVVRTEEGGSDESYRSIAT